MSPGSTEGENEAEGAVNKQRLLVQQLLDRVIKLEMQARGMLLDNLEHGVARTLLVADRNGAFSPFLGRPQLTK